MRAVSDSPGRVAVVVAGAGARGGYEAGVLSVPFGGVARGLGRRRAWTN